MTSCIAHFPGDVTNVRRTQFKIRNNILGRRLDKFINLMSHLTSFGQKLIMLCTYNST